MAETVPHKVPDDVLNDLHGALCTLGATGPSAFRLLAWVESQLDADASAPA